jgi:hypothetical protein
MKKKILTSLAILFTIVFFVSSCKKEVDKKADEDLAASAAGQYEMSYIKINGQEANLPSGGISGKVNIANKDKNIIDMHISITDSNDSSNSESSDLEDIQLKEENSVTVLYSGTAKIGTINNNELNININDGQGQELIIKARK